MNPPYGREVADWTFRATSKRTRIETITPVFYAPRDIDFQSNIQENKDWNLRWIDGGGRYITFQSNIQENKDWNLHILSIIVKI